MVTQLRIDLDNYLICFCLKTLFFFIQVRLLSQTINKQKQ